MFSESDYGVAANRLDAPVAHVKAMAEIESSGATFWEIDGEQVVPVRFEAHWFGKLTRYAFNDTHPRLSCVQWTPALAATSWRGARAQVKAAEQLDGVAAWEATSWGAFQVLGVNWPRLQYGRVAELVDACLTEAGQLDAFARFIEGDRELARALQVGDWRVVEARYNGGGFGGAYAAKLAAAAARYAAPGNSAALPRMLRLGNRGDDVKALQLKLPVEVDGIFGPLTDQAVREVQRRHGVAVDGIVGPITRGVLDL